MNGRSKWIWKEIKKFLSVYPFSSSFQHKQQNVRDQRGKKMNEDVAKESKVLLLDSVADCVCTFASGILSFFPFSFFFASIALILIFFLLCMIYSCYLITVTSLVKNKERTSFGYRRVCVFLPVSSHLMILTYSYYFDLWDEREREREKNWKVHEYAVRIKFEGKARDRR